ncbi:hypothetical protein WISP_95768 [Willisornis vidua]|uniref:Uncharacterized protein n=1 Tax=Willisornis vidua TaxID=1566151 RepID=A0ABQ9D605_9PASS|nr:hypothetical protein WISP_95768 [Willisornis vidua]
MPDSPRMDLLLAKTEPTRNDSNTSGIMYLRKKRKLLCRDENAARKEREHVNSNIDTKADGEGGAGAAPGARAVPLQPRKDHKGTETHLQPVEEPP